MGDWLLPMPGVFRQHPPVIQSVEAASQITDLRSRALLHLLVIILISERKIKRIQIKTLNLNVKTTRKPSPYNDKVCWLYFCILFKLLSSNHNTYYLPTPW
jgi:hypothetical protein